MSHVQMGTLYIVSTPIGNLEDITFRAVRILSEVELIAAEDTRYTKRLLNRYEITTPLTSFYRDNESAKSNRLVEHLRGGQSLALVSDAGTPTISDPGYRLVVSALAVDAPIVPIPGVSACIVAASVAGLPLHNFVFEGFLKMANMPVELCSNSKIDWDYPVKRCPRKKYFLKDQRKTVPKMVS